MADGTLYDMDVHSGAGLVKGYACSSEVLGHGHLGLSFAGVRDFILSVLVLSEAFWRWLGLDCSKDILRASVVLIASRASLVLRGVADRSR